MSLIGAPRLRWAHHTQAGVSNLHRSDLWSSDVVLTSGRLTFLVDRAAAAGLGQTA